MKAKLTIYCYVALLPSIIYGFKSLPKYSEDVAKIAKGGGRIEGVFQPLGVTHLAINVDYSFTYRGILLPNTAPKPITMIFSLWEKEYKMYSYLGAINNKYVEQYGIPSVYYYGKWNENNLTMIGITPFDQSIDDLQKTKQVFNNDLNVLIVIRNFILSSKYMHSCGVRHNDIKLSNIMVRGHQTFIIDFNEGSQYDEKTIGGTLDFAPRSAHTNGQRQLIDDWESFLYSICYSLGVRFEWIGGDEEHMAALKANVYATIDKIQTIESKAVRDILVEFAKFVLDATDEHEFYRRQDISLVNLSPEYNDFYELVNGAIRELNLREPAMFTWLVREQRQEAIKHLNEHQIPNIASIINPKDIYFEDLYLELDDSRKTSSSSSSSSSSFSPSAAQNPISKDDTGKRSKDQMHHRSARESPKQKSE